jgi:hypothetical protein
VRQTFLSFSDCVSTETEFIFKNWPLKSYTFWNCPKSIIIGCSES